ncbi:GntR family transcriptional regulator [Brevibacillus brevis]|uniref:GntR family transcriptional regulator n=1 Tax=Brevibacillus brevis TaxID=1393 RepID=A0ABY9TDW2_BREBE|nr:GntR family transcriptional regulator [Brevibacillus brevis]WNC17556.1 GntR family transcriptional regulator [Brevibacillus brevis]
MEKKVPMHVQLRELIREKIAEGEYGFGQAIPSERELAAMYGLNRMTVRNAIEALVKEGLLKKVQGKGTFVAPSKISSDLYKLQGFGKMLLTKGIKPSSKILYTGKRKAGSKYASVFGLDEEAELFRIIRLRLGDDEPFALEDTLVPYDLVSEIELVDFQIHSLYDFLAGSGIELEMAHETLTLVKVRDVEAKLLQVPPGSPVFLHECKSCDRMNRVVEFTKSYTNGQKSYFIADKP